MDTNVTNVSEWVRLGTGVDDIVSAVGFACVAGFAILSELLPFTDRAEANGIVHACILIYKSFMSRRKAK